MVQRRNPVFVGLVDVGSAFEKRLDLGPLLLGVRISLTAEV
jgi:hypothetical protein